MALVLAGRRGGEDPVARHCGVAYKCLAPAGGVPMLARVVAALAASPGVERIFVVLEDISILEGLSLASHPRRAAERADAEPERPAALDEVEAGLPMLVTTADHPLLSVAIVEHFGAAAVRPVPTWLPAWPPPRSSGRPIPRRNGPICA